MVFPISKALEISFDITATIENKCELATNVGGILNKFFEGKIL